VILFLFSIFGLTKFQLYKNQMKKIFALLVILISILNVHAQTCGGPALLDEHFSNGIPAGWVNIDMDGNTISPDASDFGFTGQWQGYDRLGQKCVASASNYSPAGNSDDYLITPAITVPATGACLSWKAAADSPYSTESYYVYISTTTPDAAGLQANPPLLMQGNEAPDWTEYNFGLSSYAGQTVYIGFRNYSQGWALYLDDVRISAPVNKDAAITSLNMNDVSAPGSYTLSGKILNSGIDPITSLNLNWKVDNGPVNTMSVASLNILPSTYLNYQHNIQWNVSAIGTYTMKVWASNINGTNDQYTANDTLTEILFINNFQRRPLIEEFTQASCSPCAAANPDFDAMLNPDLHAAEITSIKYHTYWPGYDPMNDDNPQLPLDRVIYYDIPAVPMALVDGVLIVNDCNSYPGSPGCLIQDEIDSAASIPTIFDIHVVNSPAGNNTNVAVTVTAKADIPFTSFRLFTVIIEDSLNYGFSPGTNGEEDFYQVARVMLPDSGQALPAMTMNQSLTFNYSYPVLSIYVPSELKTVAMIENNNNHRVYQSTVASPYSNPNGIAEHPGNFNLDIFPNPTNDLISVSVNGVEGKQISWTLTNLLGEIVLSGNETPVNSVFRKQIDLSGLPGGIYLFRMNDGNNSVIEKVEKIN
jgi:hypothetical protein